MHHQMVFMFFSFCCSCCFFLLTAAKHCTCWSIVCRQQLALPEAEMQLPAGADVAAPSAHHQWLLLCHIASHLYACSSS
jgi:hypothetical protein